MSGRGKPGGWAAGAYADVQIGDHLVLYRQERIYAHADLAIILLSTPDAWVGHLWRTSATVGEQCRDQSRLPEDTSCSSGVKRRAAISIASFRYCLPHNIIGVRFPES